jgi:hypothetical protein
MHSETDVQLCMWDTGCVNAASRHVSWIIGTDQHGDRRRDKHLCDAHTAELHERPCGAQDRAMSQCGPSCPITLNFYSSKQSV